MVAVPARRVLEMCACAAVWPVDVPRPLTHSPRRHCALLTAAMETTVCALLLVASGTTVPRRAPTLK
jgi:hypothetical protein